jgi:hypothetical protein
MENFRPFFLILIDWDPGGLTLSDEKGYSITAVLRKDLEIYILGKLAFPSPMRPWDLVSWSWRGGLVQTGFVWVHEYDGSSTPAFMYTQGWRVAVYPETKPHTKDISST